MQITLTNFCTNKHARQYAFRILRWFFLPLDLRVDCTEIILSCCLAMTVALHSSIVHRKKISNKSEKAPKKYKSNELLFLSEKHARYN